MKLYVRNNIPIYYGISITEILSYNDHPLSLVPSFQWEAQNFVLALAPDPRVLLYHHSHSQSSLPVPGWRGDGSMAF